MKGIDPLIGTALVIAISIAAIAIVLEVGIPATEKAKEIMLFDEIKGNMILLNNKISEIATQGVGSSARINLIINGGQYNFNSIGIAASMESKYQIVGSGASYVENDITVNGEVGKITLTKSYDKISIESGGSFGKGSHNINIKNEGYDDASGKQMINITIS